MNIKDHHTKFATPFGRKHLHGIVLLVILSSASTHSSVEVYDLIDKGSELLFLALNVKPLIPTLEYID